MLAPRIRLTAAHKDELALACELGPGKLKAIAHAIDAAEFTIRRSQIEETIKAQIGPEKGVVLARLLFGIAGIFRRTSLSAADALDRVEQSLNKDDSEDTRFGNWNECRAQLKLILETRSLSLAAKALDISYDFERVYLAGRLLTSVRPVFDEQRNEIFGSTIVQTLRLEFLAPNGDQSSISVAMDLDDIHKLRDECQRAINKAATAKARVERDCGFEAIIPGEEVSE
jgi:hypothetical protein